MVTDIPGQKRDKKKPGLWDRGMAIDVLVKKKREKTRSERPRYGHCQTGSKTWTPASVIHKTSPYWWTADVARPSIRGSFMGDGRRWSRFWPVWQWPYLSLSHRGFFHFFFYQNVNGHTPVSQTGFFIPFLTWDVSDHTTDPVCETSVWSLTSQSKL